MSEHAVGVIGQLFGALLLASGVFTLSVAGIALVDALASVRVRRTTIAKPVEGYALIRARVEATWGAITAPLTGLAAVYQRTSIAMVPEDDWRFERNDLVAAWEQSVAFVVNDGSGTIDIKTTTKRGVPCHHAKVSLKRLPELLEDTVQRRYGEAALLGRVGVFHVSEQAIADGDEVWLLTFGVPADGRVRPTIISVGAHPEEPHLAPMLQPAKAFGVSGALLSVFGVLVWVVS